MEILDRLRLTDQYIAELEALMRGVTAERYRSETALKYAVERLLQLTIQAILDARAAMIVAVGARKPETYADMSKVLMDIGALTPEEGSLLSGMAKFRNLLVHGYGRLIDSKVYEIAATEAPVNTRKIISALLGFASEKGVNPPPGSTVVGFEDEFRELGVRLVYIFGSSLLGRLTPESDYDIAVHLGREPQVSEMIRIMDIVSEALKIPVEKIDLLVLDTAPIDLRYAVISRGKLIYSESMEAAVRFEHETLISYLDHEPMYRLMFRALLRKYGSTG